MIDAQARDALQRLLTCGLHDAVAVDAGCSVEPCAAEAEAPQFVMLTISHAAFRLVVCLHFASDESSRDFIARRLRTAADRVSDADFRDALCEIGNELCGVMKRSLSQHFSHLGMSTPNLLERRSLPHVIGETGSVVVGARVGSGARTLFRASLIAHPYGPLRMPLEHATAAPTADGELELF